VGGVALGVAGCILAISLFRGGVLATRAFYSPAAQADLPFTTMDDRTAVIRALGEPAEDHWLVNAGAQYEALAYPQHRLYVILTGQDRENVRYAGAMDWNWRPVHGPGYHLLRRLPKF